ncbi:hypothetical protein AAFF_G00418960 [Aldrovandia affinis]|uniref:Uncharacterized protein n=1 Tax=Aldrovandia affinis TaxID=143900 RepID=A0AAD7WJV6_9TELE|nr:hypothetical protein AAFF_G00418960 [Aldrovandia affinis]
MTAAPKDGARAPSPDTPATTPDSGPPQHRPPPRGAEPVGEDLAQDQKRGPGASLDRRASPEGVTHRFWSLTPPGAQSARGTTMSVQDLSHRQTPQSTSPVEVTHRCRRATSTHLAPPDSSGHPRGSHHLATGQPRIQGPVVQSLRTRDRGGGTDGKTSPPPRRPGT